MSCRGRSGQRTRNVSLPRHQGVEVMIEMISKMKMLAVIAVAGAGLAMAAPHGSGRHTLERWYRHRWIRRRVLCPELLRTASGLSAGPSGVSVSAGTGLRTGSGLRTHPDLLLSSGRHVLSTGPCVLPAGAGVLRPGSRLLRAGVLRTNFFAGPPVWWRRLPWRLPRRRVPSSLTSRIRLAKQGWHWN